MSREAGEPIARDAFALAFAALVDDPAEMLLLAVSGGPDSTALLHAAARWSAEDGGPRLCVATVDHGLRPGSRAEAEAVGHSAVSLGLPHRVLAWDVRRPGRVSQEAARAARYRLLAEHTGSVGAAGIVFAHTLDDQAETLLIRMAAGSGPSGLAGMRRRSRRDGVTLLRPFLGFAKARLVATCQAEGWTYADDPSNRDDRFARVRWRTLLPSLAAEGLDSRRLASLAGRMGRAEDALASVAAHALEASRLSGGFLDLVHLASHPDEVVIRAVALAVQPSAALRLDRLESCVAALLAARRAGQPLRRTLSGRLLDLDRAGRLAVSAEPPRTRGRRPALTTPAVAVPHSLGIGVGHA